MHWLYKHVQGFLFRQNFVKLRLGKEIWNQNTGTCDFRCPILGPVVTNLFAILSLLSQQVSNLPPCATISSWKKVLNLTSNERIEQSSISIIKKRNKEIKNFKNLPEIRVQFHYYFHANVRALFSSAQLHIIAKSAATTSFVQRKFTLNSVQQRRLQGYQAHKFPERQQMRYRLQPICMFC